MRKSKPFLSLLAIAIITFAAIEKNMAQGSKKLSIGDKAPELKYSKWIKGIPVKSLEGDQLYVLEFWATWCGPCKLAMPHITKLQKQYNGKVTFIGVGVWEKVPVGQAYESSLPSVIQYVKGNEANMGYSVIADNNEQHMGNNWLKAAGENGIPSTFIVENNKILWIGHPNALDTIIPKIIARTYNMQAYKASFEKRAEAGRSQMEKINATLNPINEAIKAKNFQMAFALMDKVKVEQPQMKASMEMMKLGVLIDNFSLTEVQQFANGWDYPSSGSLILGEVYKRDNLSKETYLWAAKNFGSTDKVTNPLILDALATCYAKAGVLKEAIPLQERAFEIAKEALKEGKMVGTIMDYTVTEYEKKLKLYKSSAK